MREQREQAMRAKILAIGVIVFLAMGLLYGVAFASHRHGDSCWVEYAPGEVRDFAHFEDMNRGINSRVVTYELRHDTINQHYESIEKAKEWMGRVIEQLRGCN